MPVTLAELVDLVAQASVWAYLVLALVALLDALLPIVPSETAVITAGVVAAASEGGSTGPRLSSITAAAS